MNTIDRLKQLHEIFEQGKGGIALVEMLEVMEALPKLIEIAEAAEDYYTNAEDGMTADNYMKQFALRRALVKLFVPVYAEL